MKILCKILDRRKAGNTWKNRDEELYSRINELAHKMINERPKFTCHINWMSNNRRRRDLGEH